MRSGGDDGRRPHGRFDAALRRMKRFTLVAIFLTASLLLVIGCATPKPGSSRNASLPGHGAISIAIEPNPIVARNVGGRTYEFPFDVVVRGTAGRAVAI